MKKLIVGTMAVAIPFLSWLLLVSGQENADKKAPETAKKIEADKSPQAGRFHAQARPGKPGSSKVRFASEDGRLLRMVLNDLPDETDGKNFPGLRFHRPLFALAERDTPLQSDLPPIIDYIRRNADGTMLVRFRVIVSTPGFRKKCRDAVLDQERKLLAEKGLTQDDIDVEPWPLLHCVITVRDSGSRQIIGVDQTDTLTGTDEFNVTLTLAPKEYREMLALIDKGDVDFVYSYSYVGSTVHQGNVDLKGAKNAKLIASQKLRSEQIEGKEPIFQGEANEAARHVYVTVQKTMRVTHKDLIPLLDQPNLFQKLFADDGQITFKDLKQGDEQTALMLAAYLKPHLEQVRESYGGEKSDIKIHEDKVGEGKTSGSSVSASVGVPLPLPIPIGLSFGGGLSNSSRKTKEVLDRIEQATGSKWAYDKATERFRPHSIKKLKFQSGADHVLIDEKSTVFLSVGPENRYLEETPVPVTFTSKTAVDKGSNLGPYEGVPLGAVIPFFGSKLPRGYRWCNGVSEDPKNVFPNAKWVPKELRGTPLPDMRDRILGGAKDASQIGKMYAGGKLTVPGYSVEGKAFQVPPVAWERLQGEVDVGKHAKPSPNAWMILFENFEGQFSDVQRIPFTNQVIKTFKYPYVEWQQATGSGHFHRANLRPLNVPIVKGNINGGQTLPDRTVDLTQSGPYLRCRYVMRVE